MGNVCRQSVQAGAEQEKEQVHARQGDGVRGPHAKEPKLGKESGAAGRLSSTRVRRHAKPKEELLLSYLRMRTYAYF